MWPALPPAATGFGWPGVAPGGNGGPLTVVDMPSLHRVTDVPIDFVALRSTLALPPAFTDTALRQARDAAEHPQLPDYDRTDIEFITVDPPGSRDLDQAVHIAADGDGYLVSYAIADVASFVRAGSDLDRELLARGQTLYFPDARVPLHPPELSEGAASLLPEQTRPAVLWQIGLDADGEVRSIDVQRARVRSRQQCDYAGLQKAIDAGSPPDGAALLPKVGALRQACARARHAINLDIPEQEVVEHGPGRYTLALRAELPIERDNAEISLLTGMAAATLMLRAKIGILRTVPDPDPATIKALRRLAPALGVSWPAGMAPGDVLAGITRDNPRQVAFLEHTSWLLRGAGYTLLDGDEPTATTHAGLGAPYAHVTAPLRRLVDRYASEICMAIQANQPVPDWARQSLASLPGAMKASDHVAREVDRAVVDTVEAWLLADRVGESFSATVLDVDERGATVALDEPVVRARCRGGDFRLGQRITVRLQAADVTTHTVTFEPA
jgi:exoribonuclease R